jgi:hypothetical protein
MPCAAGLAARVLNTMKTETTVVQAMIGSIAG